jgi:hypothetical protein
MRQAEDSHVLNPLGRYPPRPHRTGCLVASPRSPPSGMLPAEPWDRVRGAARPGPTHPSGAHAGARRPPARAKPPDPRGALPIRARDHVRGAQPRGPLRSPALTSSQASLRRGGRSASPPLPLRFLFRLAGVPMQGAPPLRCGVRREGALRAGGGSKSQPAMARVTVSHGSEPVQPSLEAAEAQEAFHWRTLRSLSRSSGSRGGVWPPGA